MQTLRTLAKADADGVLHLDIRAGAPDAEYEVVIVLQAKSAEPRSKTPEELGWPPRFFEETAGAIQDPTFRRHEQGKFEKRLEFE